MIRALFRKSVKVFWMLPGLLLWASFPPRGECADVLFALAPLLWVSRNGTVRESVRRWFLNGLLFWFATLGWMPAIVKNGGPWPLVVLGWFGLAAYCAAYFAAFGYLSARYWRWAAWKSESPFAKPAAVYARRLLGLAVVEPVLWAGLEIVRSRFLGGFAWNQLGVAVVNAGFGAPAALGGVFLLSALVVLINGTIASMAERFLAPVRHAAGVCVPEGFRKWRSVETLLPLALVWAFYQVPAPEASVAAEAETLRVALVQRNFPCCFQGRTEDPDSAYAKLLRNVTPLKPDLVVLPESAFAEVGSLDGFSARRFAEWIRSETDAAAVLAGGGRETDGKMYNSAALYATNAVSFYDKVHLVPFGEFIPGDKLFPVLQKLAPVGSCSPGELKLLSLATLSANAEIPLGVAICFEDTDSAQMRALAAKGARLLAFITNDSWFSHSDEALQHAWQARARAIETALPVVRVGNSGVTGTILPDGRASWLVGSDGRPLCDRAGTMFDRLAVPVRAPTVYVRLGDAPLLAAFALLLTAILFRFRRRANGGDAHASTAGVL